VAAYGGHAPAYWGTRGIDYYVGLAPLPEPDPWDNRQPAGKPARPARRKGLPWPRTGRPRDYDDPSVSNRTLPFEGLSSGDSVQTVRGKILDFATADLGADYVARILKSSKVSTDSNTDERDDAADAFSPPRRVWVRLSSGSGGDACPATAPRRPFDPGVCASRWLRSGRRRSFRSPMPSRWAVVHVGRSAWADYAYSRRWPDRREVWRWNRDEDWNNREPEPYLPDDAPRTYLPEGATRSGQRAPDPAYYRHGAADRTWSAYLAAQRRARARAARPVRLCPECEAPLSGRQRMCPKCAARTRQARHRAHVTL
jgi:hypothetical protein